MITIPLQINRTEYDLFIVLEEENLTRLKEYDPAEILTSRLGSFANLKVRGFYIYYASPEEVLQVASCQNLGEVAACLKNLSRGWKFRPEQGDNDAPYQSPAKN